MPGVVERGLEPEGEQDDARDHREVQVRVDVPGERGAFERGGFGEAGPGDEALRTEADGDDGLPEGDQDDLAEPFDDTSRRPASSAWLTASAWRSS